MFMSGQSWSKMSKELFAGQSWIAWRSSPAVERKVAVVEILKTSAGSVPPRLALALSLFIYGVFLIMPLQGWQRSPSKEWSLKLGGSHLSRPSESFCVLLLLYLLFGYSFVLWRLFLSSFFSGFLCLQFVYSCVFLIVSQNTWHLYCVQALDVLAGLTKDQVDTLSSFSVNF